MRSKGFSIWIEVELRLYFIDVVGLFDPLDEVLKVFDFLTSSPDMELGLEVFDLDEVVRFLDLESRYRMRSRWSSTCIEVE